jgi:hypothetical protein
MAGLPVDPFLSVAKRNKIGNGDIGEVGPAVNHTPAAVLKALDNERFHGQVSHLAIMRPQADLFQSFHNQLDRSEDAGVAAFVLIVCPQVCTPHLP